MKILGIETSCDETAASVVENGTKILSSVISSSEDIHAKTGGIIPENAARKQVEYIIPVIQKAILQAFNLSGSESGNSESVAQELLINEVDAIAVTYGPGLIGSLLVGVETAKTLSLLFNKPLIPVNHVLAHTYANWLTSQKSRQSDDLTPTPEFPAVSLIVSGGHTELLLMSGHSDFKYLGGTRDDAAGEAFDKIARILGLPYPGGPFISNKADVYLKNHDSVTLELFPRPMSDSNDLDFSFSGLKTSVNNYLRKNNNVNVSYISAEVQEAISDSLTVKAMKACGMYKPRSLLLSGGVAANNRLREKLYLRSKAECADIVFHVPKPGLCTDNASFIASRAFFNNNITPWGNINAVPQLTLRDL